MRALLWIHLAVLLLLLWIIGGVIGPTGTLLDYLLAVVLAGVVLALVLLVRTRRR